MITLKQIANRLASARLEGDDQSVQFVAKPGNGSSEELEVWLDEPVDTTAPAVVDDSLDIERSDSLVLVENLKDRLSELLALFEDDTEHLGIHPTAVVSDQADIADSASVGPHCVIEEGVILADNVTIHSNVTVHSEFEIQANCVLHSGVRIQSHGRLGAGSTIHSNSVIGSDGFGYNQEEGNHKKTPQVGGVRIGSDVEIGACVTIDRATYGYTSIGQGTKIDNLVQIGHNCTVGDHCILVGHSGLAGSVDLADHVTIGGQAAVTDHVSIADGVTIAGRAGVTNDVDDEEVVLSGFPARPHREHLRIQATLSKLPSMRKNFNQLEETVTKLQKET